ncbi:thiol-disulfide isomerase/thioredoxin [Lipingzhangella halophila]|uniref:Thiol-disulfide isomerase/thioredoxin n=1 Tax=Lipingzhangella halophila TaxID=1783352 RepID=A0A7W7RCW6_9ACTN|nr:TlpA disulfide reductase family protein [Lipingzhangella halophila]MBB4929288.1 thiol-disulfide isomerase/thioredoxin [Lipingzhangella halophila]
MSCARTGSRRRRVLPGVAAAAAVLVALTGCAGGGETQTSGNNEDERFVEGDGSSTSYEPEEREPAPEVSGETLDGDDVSLADHRGEVLVMNIWASWCGPCREEMPVLSEVHGEFSDDGLAFLGVNIKDDRTAAKAFADNYGVAYPSIYDQPGQVPQAFRDTVPPKAIPSTLVIDREGRIAARVIGPVTYNQLTGLVEPVLDEEAASGGGAGSA